VTRQTWAAVVTCLAVAITAQCVTGCGASAIRLHAEGVAISTVAIEGAQGQYLAELDRQMGACADEACVTSVRSSLRPLETALDTADTAVRAWRDAIEIALLAETESPALLDTLLVVGLRFLARWGDARTIGSGHGFDLPALTLPGLNGGE
jgi:hypothetical protein